MQLLALPGSDKDHDGKANAFIGQLATCPTLEDQPIWCFDAYNSRAQVALSLEFW